MVLYAPERAMMTRLRNMQLERRLAEVTWDRLVPVDTSLGPALDVKYTKIDHKVDVKRWRTGNPRLGTVAVAVGDDSIKMGFYGVELTQNWWENWLKANMIKEPNAAIFDHRGVFDQRRLERLAVDEIERAQETDFYDGNDEIGWDGMTTLAGAATSLTSDLSTEAGRQEFYETIIAKKAEAKNPGGDDRRIVGQLQLAIDSEAMAYLDHLYDTASGNQRTALEYVAQAVGGMQNIVEVEATSMAGKAMLHWKDAENVVAFNGTPQGVVLATRGDANRGDDAHTRIFTNMGFHEFRDNSVKLIDSLLPA